MKQKLLLFLLLFLVGSLQACYVNPGSNVGKLQNLFFFDENERKIDHSTFENELCIPDEEYQLIQMSQDTTPLNSPKPANYYFCVSIPRQIDIIIRFVIIPGKHYQFESIQLGGLSITKDDVTIQEENGYLLVDYRFSKETITEGRFSLAGLKLSITNGEETIIRDGTTKPHFNVSYKAIVFQFEAENNPES